MKFRFVHILFFTFSIQVSNAQVFKEDWKAFTSDTYLIDFNSEITTYYGTDTRGELHFKLKADQSKYVVLFVFDRNKTME